MVEEQKPQEAQERKKNELKVWDDAERKAPPPRRQLDRKKKVVAGKKTLVRGNEEERVSVILRLLKEGRF